MGRVDGKVALVTGSGNGQGRAEAKMLAREGAKVAVADIRDDDGKRVEAEINETGGACLYLHLDVTNEESWQAAIAATIARFGKLDILVNNAGIYRIELVEETSVELWDQVMEINSKGVFLGTKHAIPELRKAGGGSVINISSTAGLVGSNLAAAYSASKGAVRLFTKATAIQYAQDGIRANSIHPGIIQTDMTAALLADPNHYQERLDRTPLGRIGKPEDVAYGALFLASDESSFMTGSELVIDGGRTAT